MKRFRRVLIANRGEIAVRIIRSLRELGIESVAVYSDADAASLHRRLADYAVRLPGSASADTYLKIPALIEATLRSGADAVHPGYGFLSENGAFAEAVTEAGAVFIGPSARAMDAMGNKVHAKALMREHGVPTVPGSPGALRDAEDLKEVVADIGLPIILKAANGGGGRGMRIVRDVGGLEEAFAACRREAIAYFGSDEVFCERYIENPRHIEFQVMFDAHGNGVHLFERDCSVQRRHQKLVEEAPSSFLSAEERHRIGRDAVQAARAAGYVGAGTIEFICETPERAYFMEMNTRIQVEHPVTEMITGHDLIALQVRVAMGEPLPFRQEDLVLNGWAIETRINAEDPAKGFAPAPGLVRRVQLPQGPFVRVDTMLYDGYRIPDTYDSMVAKIITWGRDRDEALRRQQRALMELVIEGVPTTARFHEALMRHPDFVKGDVTTRFIEDNQAWFDAELSRVSDADARADAALVAAVLAADTTGRAGLPPPSSSLWRDRARLEMVDPE
jgi:acetyl-CoA carboxylase biotin carboxylase subunit